MDEPEKLPIALPERGLVRLARAMICVEPEDLLRATRGQLDSEQLNGVKYHCMWCEECREELQAIALLTAAGRPARRPATATGALWAAAAAAAVALLAFGLWYQAGARSRDEATLVDERAAVVANPARLLVRQAGQERLTVVEADKILVTVDTLRMFMGLTRSTASGDDADARARIIGAIDALESGDAAGATARLEQFATSHDVFGTPLLGIARYVAGQDIEKAREALEFAATSQPVDPVNNNSLYIAAVWCLGRVELVRGEVDSARAIWEQIADPEGTAFQRLAAAGLELL